MTARSRAALKLALRLGTVAAIAAVAVVYRDEVGEAFRRALDVGWVALLALPLFVLWNFVAAQGWHAIAAVTARERPPPAWRLMVYRIEAQAVNLVLPLASVPGEVLKSSLTAPSRGALMGSATAVALDTVAAFTAGLLFTILGGSLHWALVPGGRQAMVLLGVLAAVLLGLLYLVPFGAARVARLAVLRDTAVGQGLNDLARDGQPLRRSMRHSTFWHVLERVLTAGEIWLVSWGLGLELGPSGALFATALMTGMTLVFFFIPAQAGAAEGGLSLAFTALGLPPTLGLSVGLVRRGRQLVVAAVGWALLLFLERDAPASALRRADPPDSPDPGPGRRTRAPEGVEEKDHAHSLSSAG
jgi:hypothetical protein